MSWSWLLPENVPFAVKVKVEPAVGLRVEAVTAIESNGPVLTVIVEVPVIVPEVAVMVAVPGGLARVAAAFARPPRLTVATVGSDVVQSTLPVRSLVLLSAAYVPVADNCRVCPSMSDTDAGATASEVSVGLTKNPRQLAPRASSDSAAKVAKIRRFRLQEGMVKKFRQTYFRGHCPLEVATGIVAEKVLAEPGGCTSVCTKVGGRHQLRQTDKMAAFRAAPRAGKSPLSTGAGVLLIC